MSIILTEKRNKDTIDIDLMSSYEIVKKINDEDKKVAIAVEKVLPEVAKAVDYIAEAFKNGGRLGYFGAGTSGRIGVLDASECPPTFGSSFNMVQGFIAGGDKALRNTMEGAEDIEEYGIGDLKSFNPTKNDVVVAISASGNPMYVLAVLKEAKKRGAKTVGVSSNPSAKLAEFSDVFINPIVGEEALTGSSRMKSGTAQKLVLNMLTTSAMILNGKTYENYMIDLNVSNDKLYDRAVRIVSEVIKVSSEKAMDLLRMSGNNVKIACVMGNRQVSKDEALKLLDEANGVLRKILC